MRKNNFFIFLFLLLFSCINKNDINYYNLYKKQMPKNTHSNIIISKPYILFCKNESNLMSTTSIEEIYANYSENNIRIKFEIYFNDVLNLNTKLPFTVIGENFVIDKVIEKEFHDLNEKEFINKYTEILDSGVLISNRKNSKIEKINVAYFLFKNYYSVIFNSSIGLFIYKKIADPPAGASKNNSNG